MFTGLFSFWNTKEITKILQQVKQSINLRNGFRVSEDKGQCTDLWACRTGNGGVLWMEIADAWLYGGVGYFPGRAALRETTAGILLLTHPPQGDIC